MDKFSKAVLFSSFLIMFLSVSSYAQTCDYSFSNNVLYSSCLQLPVLNSFLHWTYHPSNQSVDIAYRHTGMTTSNWIVWALHPTDPSNTPMLGAQCLVAFQNNGQFRAYTSPIASSPAGYSTTLAEGNLSFPVPQIGGEFVNGEMIIYATIQLPSASTTFNQVWQFGDVSGSAIQRHPTNGDHLRSFGTIDFASGQTVNTGASSGGSRDRNRNIHGVLNAVSWGLMMPIGVIMARYLKVFKVANPAWFYAHVTCQASGYIVGVAGWATGLRLGSDSPGIERTTHRNIGITIFALGTLQVFALLLRPKPDHKYRFYWNIYHHLTGYTVIILSIVNIFEGFDILGREDVWRRVYIGLLIFLGGVVLVLEPYTWWIVLKKKSESGDKYPDVHATNGHGNGFANGHEV